jgi:calcium-dependent protein kinase
MGNICCQKPNPEIICRSRGQSFSSIQHIQTLIPRNHQSFDMVYSIGKEKLGFGGYGDVKLCVHRRLELTRAVKILYKDHLLGLNTDSSWFSTKIEILHKLDHPFIIKSHEYFEDREFYHLVMEYHEEGDLLKYLKQGKILSEKNAKTIMHQLLTAVDFLHNSKIAHRDIKLENILISEKEGISIKLIDFDTAAFFDEGGLTGRQGTLHYMAPETIGKNYDEKCDIWSCGVIFYTLITGKTCLPGMTQGQNPSKLKLISIDFSLPVFQSVSSKSLSLLKQMLQKDPSKRISAKNALSHKWFQNLDPFIEDKISSFSKLPVNQTSLLCKSIKRLVAYFPANRQALTSAEKFFIALDSDNDGVVSFEDILSCFSKVYPEDRSYNLMDQMQKKAGESQDGKLTFSEFLLAFIDIEEGLLENISNLFKVFCDSNEKQDFCFSVNQLDSIKIWKDEEKKAWKDLLKEKNFWGFEEFSLKVVKSLINTN